MAASGLVLALTACGGRAGEQDRVASSSWFGSCRDDGDCRDGQCLCGVCTQSCEASNCSEAPPGSSCIEPGERAHERLCAGRTAPALCLVRCDDGECDDGFSCRDGVCLPDAVAALTPDDGPEPSNAADACGQIWFLTNKLSGRQLAYDASGALVGAVAFSQGPVTAPCNTVRVSAGVIADCPAAATCDCNLGFVDPPDPEETACAGKAWFQAL